MKKSLQRQHSKSTKKRHKLAKDTPIESLLIINDSVEKAYVLSEFDKCLLNKYNNPRHILEFLMLEQPTLIKKQFPECYDFYLNGINRMATTQAENPNIRFNWAKAEMPAGISLSLIIHKNIFIKHLKENFYRDDENYSLGTIRKQTLTEKLFKRINTTTPFYNYYSINKINIERLYQIQGYDEETLQALLQGRIEPSMVLIQGIALALKLSEKDFLTLKKYYIDRKTGTLSLFKNNNRIDDRDWVNAKYSTNGTLGWYKSKEFDKTPYNIFMHIIDFCLSKQEFDLHKINAILKEYGYSPLFK